MIQSKKSSNKITLLFVDDEPMILVPLRALFKKSYKVHIANSAQEALEILRENHIDIVVSDQKMPEMTGTELLHQVKTLSPHSIRILLTGYAELTSLIASINMGEVHRFIEKPWKNNVLVSIIDGAASTVHEHQAALKKEQQEEALKKFENKRLETENRIQQAYQQTKPELPDETSALNSTNKQSHICIIDSDKHAYDILKKNFSKNHTIHYYDSFESSIGFLKKYPNISILIISLDVSANIKMPLYLLNQLRSLHSLMISIVLTRQQDTQEIIELINKTQIFRYLGKPVSEENFSYNIDLALGKYSELKMNPNQQVYTNVEQLTAAQMPDKNSINSILNVVQHIKTSISQLFNFK